MTKYLRVRLEERVKANPTPSIIREMGKCFDLGDLIDEEETIEVEERRLKSLKKVLEKAKYEEEKKKRSLKSTNNSKVGLKICRILRVKTERFARYLSIISSRFTLAIPTV